MLPEEAPVDRPCELHHWMSEVDNLVEPRPEEIAMARFPTLLTPHESPPVAATTQPTNHGPQAGSICKKTRPQRPQPGKYKYFTQPKTYSGSEAWEFFTDDALAPRQRGGRRRSARFVGTYELRSELASG